MDPSGHLAILPAVRQIMREEGLGALYRGITPSLIGMVPYSAAYYYCYEGLKSSYRKLTGRERITAPETMLIGGLSGKEMLELTLNIYFCVTLYSENALYLEDAT